MAIAAELVDRETRGSSGLGREELGACGRAGDPEMVDVVRYPRMMPQYVVGHLDRVSESTARGGDSGAGPGRQCVSGRRVARLHRQRSRSGQRCCRRSSRRPVGRRRGRVGGSGGRGGRQAVDVVSAFQDADESSSGVAIGDIDQTSVKRRSRCR
ncbi:MAG: hypothetical protein Ct9H300mP1_03750 [Planctomycetaceae bacterium]|nr:MAG: hypothetical protein Ct9H300mP1_03750 [Planctomycetaceae bacterium]